MRRSPAVLLTALVALVALAVPGLAQAADPLRPQQWHLDQVGAPTAWSVARGPDVVIAVVDTGVQLDHPDLEGRLVPGRDLVAPGTPPDDENGHGTLVAGVIAAVLDNGVGGAGVSPSSLVMPVRVLDADGRGEPADVAQGIRWAVANGADIVNLSLTEQGQDGVSRPGGLITSDVEVAIRQARAEGVLVVAAAGNEGQQRTPYRSGVPVLVVGATDRADGVWAESNRDSVTLFAPGVEIISTHSGGGYARADGTSFAAPIVAAGAALLLGINPDASPAAVEQRLRDTAEPIGSGAGRVDLARAVNVRVASAPPPAVPSPPAPPPTEPPAASQPETAPPPDPAPPQGGLPQATPIPQPEPPAEPSGTPEPAQALAPIGPIDPPSLEEAPAIADPAPRGEPLAFATPPTAAAEREEVAFVPSPLADATEDWPVPLASALLAATVLGHLGHRRTQRADASGAPATRPHSAPRRR